ncbi:hypothetical protein [Miltoncostaea oceani]|uniref:recombination directionality factor n=1 Tax=Miltoncostaea oceani TaxID=2843216 RepID=UPI001C3C6559|nr:hypothetical protein [Miltoncostaea oceani]
MARRRITTVLDQQHALREIARVRFGERKGANRPGRPMLLPRVTSQSREVVEQVAAVYGGDVLDWRPDDKAAPQFEVTITKPEGLAIAVPPGEPPFTSAYEQWAGGINTVRCDGDACQFRVRGRWTERACVCAQREAEAAARDEDYERPCKLTTRLSFCILGIEILGRARVDTKSFYAAQEVPATLAMLQASGRAAWLRMEPRSRSVMVWDEKAGVDKPTTKRFPVIVVEAPFMVDEVMLLERGETMAQIPAPAPRQLARGERPQLGPGAAIEPVGPQLGDREPPPREVPRVDLPPVTAAADEPPAESGEVIPPDDGDEDPAVEAAYQAAIDRDQASLPLEDARQGAAPGDA